MRKVVGGVNKKIFILVGTTGDDIQSNKCDCLEVHADFLGTIWLFSTEKISKYYKWWVGFSKLAESKQALRTPSTISRKPLLRNT